MFIHNKKGVSYVKLMKVLCSYFLPLRNLPQNPDPYGTQTDVSMRPQTTLQQESVLSSDDFVQSPFQQNFTGTSQMQEVVAPIQHLVHKPSSSNNNSTNQVLCHCI